MKIIGILLFILIAGIVYLNQEPKIEVDIQIESSSDSILENAYQAKQNNLQVEGSGTVIKILSDDNEGSRHQRFILRLGSGQTLLIAHNIDIAQRLEPLSTGDRVSFYGEYEWNNQGGIIHWTHRDPNGRHNSGWLRKD